MHLFRLRKNNKFKSFKLKYNKRIFSICKLKIACLKNKNIEILKYLTSDKLSKLYNFFKRFFFCFNNCKSTQIT